MMSGTAASSDVWSERIRSLIWRTPALTVGERTRRRVTLRLIPFLFFLYILAYLDRVNISVAQFGMASSPGEGGLGFGRDVIGFGAGIFFWGYWILEIPSTLSVARWGARWVFVRILVLWGACASLTGLIGTPFASALFGWLPEMSADAAFVRWLDGAGALLLGWTQQLGCGAGVLHLGSSAVDFCNGLPDTPRNQFYLLRFLLGFFEGGFFPSVIVYLSYWFRAADRGKAIAGFMAAIPLASMIGLPVSGLLLAIDWFGLPGWRWILILEGVAPILAVLAALFLLPDRPAKARWLPAEERDWLVVELAAEQRAKRNPGHGAWVRHMGIVLLLTIVYFCLGLTSYGLSMFMPAIIKTQSGLSSQAASYLAAVPYVLALLGMLVNGWHSDRMGERPWHVAAPLALLGLGVLLTASLDGFSVLPVLLMIFGVGTFLYAYLPPFWPMPMMYLGPTAAASAVGFINMVGNLGGSIGPIMVGNLTSEHDDFAPALLRLAPWPIVAAGIVVFVGCRRRPVEPQDLSNRQQAGDAQTGGQPPALVNAQASS
jgi:MFS transporter, ACS family, tartrate transporter